MSSPEDITASDARVAEIFAKHDPKVLIIGASGQIGTDLTNLLLTPNEATGKPLVRPENLTVADIGKGFDKLQGTVYPGGNAVRKESLNIMDGGYMKSFMESAKPDIVINLAAVLSAQMAKDPMAGYNVNFRGAQNVFEAIAATKGDRHPILFIPSSIAACGTTPDKRDGWAAQEGEFGLHNGNYGQTKAMVEQLIAGVPHMGIKGVSMRPPVVASHPKIMGGGGTTEYSVDIARHLLRGEEYVCPIEQDCKLPIITGTDITRAFTHLLAKALDTPFEDRKKEMAHGHHYNIPGVSMSPQDIFENVQKCLPVALRDKAAIAYKPDAGKVATTRGWHAQAEGEEFRKDCGFVLSHDTPEKFAAYMLAGFATKPELLFKDTDGDVKRLEIRRNCELVREHLSKNFNMSFETAPARAA